MIKPIALGAALALSTAATALTVHTRAFMRGATAYNGLEGLAGFPPITSGVSYTEQGITLQYVGDGGVIQSEVAAEGAYSWYPIGGGTGYTRVTFGGPVTAVQFYAGSGWGLGGTALQYEVRNGGTLVDTGILGGVPNWAEGFVAYGFSGAAFDELRLQVQSEPSLFDADAYEGGMYDAFSIGGIVPEPTSWALMVTGFGLVGAAMRRRVSFRPA